MALVVYDMQVGIRSQIKNGDEITVACADVLNAARKTGMRVVFTRHLSNPKPWMGVSQYRTSMAWQHTDDPSKVRPVFLRDSPATAIVPELAPTADELVIEKLSMSAFEGTPLEFALRDCGIVAFAIVGIALEIGIEPTVRHASDLGFIPVVLTDACGYGNREAAERTLATMRFIGDAVLTDVAAFSSYLDRSGKPTREASKDY
jgi:nicotinamidase-related amidase